MKCIYCNQEMTTGGCINQCGQFLGTAIVNPNPDREGFFEKLWEDFCFLQKGNFLDIVKEVERYRKLDAAWAQCEKALLSISKLQRRIPDIAFPNEFDRPEHLLDAQKIEDELECANGALTALKKARGEK
jgi:hypothetical protein